MRSEKEILNDVGNVSIDILILELLLDMRDTLKDIADSA